MIANDRPGEIKVRSAPQRAEKPTAERRTPSASKAPADKGGSQDNRQRGGRAQSSAPLPLNLNVQIHISADASTDQIETIFAAMRKYLHDEPA
jgi:hypothetical protein